VKRFAAIALLCAGCASRRTPSRVPDSEQYLPPDVEAISLLGKPLHSPQLAPAEEKRREEELAKAQREYEMNPDSADAALVVGDRLADLGRYREAINVFTDAIRKHPDDARLYRDRGHRDINVRRFHEALNDLQFAELARAKSDDVERQQIFYHLGLAYYLLGDFEKALAAYRRSLPLAKTPDRLVATTDWTYMTLRRLGRAQEAEKLLEPISIDLEVVDSVAHHKLLLMYEGEIAPEELVKQDANTTDGATILYAIGNWYFINGQPDRANPLWRKILDGSQAFSFGYVAAEAEMARLDKARPSPSQ
jgi:tetratricopeptide (TPR) repeat protein